MTKMKKILSKQWERKTLKHIGKSSEGGAFFSVCLSHSQGGAGETLTHWASFPDTQWSHWATLLALADHLLSYSMSLPRISNPRLIKSPAGVSTFLALVSQHSL